MKDYLAGKPPSGGYAQQDEADVSGLQTVDEISERVAARAECIDRRLKRASLAILPSNLAAARLPPFAKAAQAGFVDIVETLSAMQTAISVGTQAAFLVGTLAVKKFGSSDPEKLAEVRKDIRGRFFKALKDACKDVVADFLGKLGGVVIGDAGAGEATGDIIGESLGGFGQALGAEVKDARKAAEENVSPSAEEQPDGSTMVLPPYSGAVSEVEGMIRIPVVGGDQFVKQGEVQVCPPLGGASAAPGASAPSYDDGSYTAFIPIGYGPNPDKICAVILHPVKGPDQTAYVDLTGMPKEIVFPGLTLDDVYGSAVGAGTFPNCPMIGGVGYSGIHIRFPDTSLAALLSNGGSVMGKASYTLTQAGVQKCKPSYSSQDVSGMTATLTVQPGGNGTLDFGAGAFTVQVTRSAEISGKQTVPGCGSGSTSCTFNLSLAPYH